MTPVAPRPAASVLLVRAGERAPLEVFMVRRSKAMRFMAGYYAFPGGKVDPADAAPELLARCRGIAPSDAAADHVHLERGCGAGPHQQHGRRGTRDDGRRGGSVRRGGHARKAAVTPRRRGSA